MMPRSIATLFALALAGCTSLAYTGGARPVAPEQLDAGWLRAAPTPVVRQQRAADCGLAALAMIAGAWGRPWTIVELDREVRSTGGGIKLGALRDLARSRGLEAYAIRGAPADLERELAHGRPVVLGLLLPFERGRARRHYEVVVAIDPRDGRVATLDPATGAHRVRSRAALEAEWRPADHAMLVVVADRIGARDATRRRGFATR
ncbi:MAG: cysteine peptidase family C39 domain-containing protein [Kofleriaceae bacterium]